jgi:short-subunit dehydrogenase
LDFSNRNILITGASSGIGYQLAKDLAKEGANLALLAIRKNIIDDLAEELRSFPSRDDLDFNQGKIITTYCDVTSKESVKESFNYVKKEFVNIDIVILNSGASYRMTVEEFNSDHLEEIFNVNLMGLVYCLNEIIPDFIQKRNGCIVGISSLSEVRGFPASAAYCSSKAAVSIFLESVRIELKKYNIKVLTVKPGFIKTPMTDKNEFYMPFFMSVEKAAGIIIRGIKKEKRIIQFPLATVLGSKLLKFLPDKVYDYLLSLPLPPRK